MDALAKACPKCGRRYDTAAAFCQKDGERLQLTEEEEDRYIGTTLLDQFKIEEKIGAGGMGSVYRARQTTLHRDVAIKILHPELADNRDAVRRFKREARVCTALDHPNVVRVFLFGQLPDGSLYIVMEFLRGRSLLDVIGREGALPVHRALHIAAQICDGVGEAHAHGVVHRDIKPENIVLVARSRDPDTVKVLDFGIARVLWGDDQTQGGATQSGLVFGTARYISPEGAAGERTDARSDVYSLGVLTYQLLSGETPFDAASPVAMLMKHIHATPPHLLSQERARHVPEPVADVVMRALAKNPDGRYEDAQAFGDALRVAAEGAGFEVKDRRTRGAPSISPSNPPPERPSASLPPAVTPVLIESTPRMEDLQSEPPPESSTLSGAPNPFGENDENVSLPGYKPKRPTSSSWKIVAAAFVFGILLVGGAFAAVRYWPRDAPEQPAQPIAEWVSAARAALARGQYDEPREGSVLVITDRVLRHDPENAEARTLRDEAAAGLVSRAREAAERGERDEARAIYARALVFRPDDEAIESARAALDQPVAPVSAPGVRTNPLHVLEGQEITLTAVLEPDAVVGERQTPRFVLKRGEDRAGDPIPATALEGGRSFEARHTFATAGRYRLLFRVGTGADRIEMSTDIEVHRDPSRAARPRPPERDPPSTITQGGNWGPPNIAPAWTNTPVVQNPPPEPPPPPPPEPWTGSVM